MANKILPPITLKLVSRAWSGVSTNAGQGPFGTCWEWQKGVNSEGYGAIQIARFSYKTHRVAYRIYYGEDPADKLVLHSCDNPPCVHPFHLYLGTDDDNAKDRERRQRGNHANGDQHGTHTRPDTLRRGEDNHYAKLTEAEVLAMRAEYTPRRGEYPRLARKYGITDTHVSYIINRKAWKHI